MGSYKQFEIRIFDRIKNKTIQTAQKIRKNQLITTSKILLLCNDLSQKKIINLIILFGNEKISTFK